jgi:hypothetical protein
MFASNNRSGILTTKCSVRTVEWCRWLTPHQIRTLSGLLSDTYEGMEWTSDVDVRQEPKEEQEEESFTGTKDP